MVKLSVRRLARLLLLCLWAISIYKAATVSISADEAYTFNRSVMVKIPDLWQTFDANDHVLHTLLCKVTVALFGASEFTLRIPALLGGLLLLWAMRRVSFALFGETWFGLGVFAALGLNPFVLDYGSIARGYGMAMAFWLTAWDQLLRHYAEPHTRWRLRVAGLALGLAVTANMTFVVPGVALVAAFLVLHLGVPASRREWSRVRARMDLVADQMIVPGVLVTVVLLLVPLLPMTGDKLYVGSETLRDAALNLAYAQVWRPLNLFEGTSLQKLIEPVVVNLALPLTLFVLAVGSGVCVWRRQDSWRILGLTALGTVALLTVMSYGLKMPLPYRRTGLYLVPLLTWLSAALLERVRPTAWVCGGVWVMLLLANWDLRYYDEWLHDAGNRELMRFVSGLRPKEGARVSLGSTFPLNHSAAFYQHTMGMTWLEVAHAPKNVEGQNDIYLLTQEDLPIVKTRGLIVRYQHPVSKVSVAVPLGR